MQNFCFFIHTAFLSDLQAIPPSSHMIDLLKFLNMVDVEVIIISDSNSVFIEMWLTAMKIMDIVKKVYTNPAFFDTSGLLNISMHHSQTWCDICPLNLCKGQVLDQYLKDRRKDGISFSSVAYVGDGKNDFCPCTKLSSDDHVFARKGYSLEKLLEASSKKETDSKKVLANQFMWRSALDIKDILFTVL